MNEYVEIRLRRNDKPLRVKRQVPGGVELDEVDPIQRTVYIGVNPSNEITSYRMRRVRQLQGWEPTQFKLIVAVEDGAIVVRGVDQFAFPPGRYALRVRVEEAKTKELKRAVEVPEDGHAVLQVDVKTDDRDAEVDLTTCDDEIRRVLQASALDDEDGIAWLVGVRRPTRKACLLNLLASLRSRPTLSQPLIGHVERFFWISNDRAYARVDSRLLPRLESLALDPKKPFYREGKPRAAVHLRLLEEIPEPPEVRAQLTATRLVSFRGEGRPSLQTVLVDPPPGFSYTYAEFDLDLGNALQDVVGFLTHMGELLDGKPTNHLDLHKALARTKARDFLHYKVSLA